MKKYYRYLALAILLLVSQYKILPSILANTLIKTSRGLVPIEQLSVGDTVTSCDPEQDAFIEVAITQIFKKTADMLVIIDTDKGILYATPDQLFYESELGSWIEAQDLTPNNILIDYDFYNVQCLSVEYLNTPVTTYEITIKSPHVLYTSCHEILTHNFFGIFGERIVFHAANWALQRLENTHKTLWLTGN